ncbi:MAG: hypothetical protein FWG96_06800 [Methanomassiliicoccaceae archaeon]|nr:hypothetical protein [Methanomassiliicoccaceae archaeon]
MDILSFINDAIGSSGYIALIVMLFGMWISWKNSRSPRYKTRFFRCPDVNDEEKENLLVGIEVIGKLTVNSAIQGLYFNYGDVTAEKMKVGLPPRETEKSLIERINPGGVLNYNLGGMHNNFTAEFATCCNETDIALYFLRISAENTSLWRAKVTITKIEERPHVVIDIYSHKGKQKKLLNDYYDTLPRYELNMWTK